MGLKDVFSNGVATIFSVFDDICYDSVLQHVADDGWGTTEEILTTFRSIKSTYSHKDAQDTTFGHLIQQTDSVLLIKSADLVNSIYESDIITLDEDGIFNKYRVVAWDVDPSDSLYQVLVRKG